jgi:hypothetical protein
VAEALKTENLLLELFHPDGRACTSLVIGSNCPARLLPESRAESGEGAALVLLAPSVEECRKDGWLSWAAQQLASRLADDGVGYVLAPRRWRYRLARQLHGAGLRVGSPCAHIPDWESSLYLVPLAAGPVRHVFNDWIPTPAWKRILGTIGLLIPGAGQLLGYLWPSAGLVVRRPGARPLFEWLGILAGNKRRTGSNAIRRSWRDHAAATTLYHFSGGLGRPASMVKVVPERRSARNLKWEAAALERLGPAARGAGARVPRLIRFHHDGLRSALVQTVVSGRSASDLLASQPDQLWPVVTQVVGWLERWQRATAAVRRVEGECLSQAILEPAARLAPLIERGEEYRSWLAARCKTLSGKTLPRVATHNDLTMANVLIDGHGRPGVIDWETAQAEGWPLGDFFYALTDAVRIASGGAERLEAFQACFTTGGAYRSRAASLQARLVSGVEIDAGLADLCFHACWLHHAQNEQRADPPEAARPFLRIVQWLAINHSECG